MDTFAQIAGAAEHSLPDVNVTITPSGSIVGQGVTASGGALRICGGNIDAILKSFGGIQGGNDSVGGKSLALLDHVGVLGGQLENMIDGAMHHGDATHALAQAKEKLGHLHGYVDKAKRAVDVLAQQDTPRAHAGMMSLAFGGTNQLVSIADTVGGLVNSASFTTGGDADANVDFEGGDMEGGEIDGGKLNDLSERLIKHRQEIQRVVNEFIKAFGANLNSMTDSVNGMAEDLGKRIDFDEKTQVFLETFERLNEFIKKDTRGKMYQYLLELNHDMQIDSKEVKDRFISLLRDLASRADAMDSTASVKGFSSACSAIISTINQYSDKMKTFRDDLEKSGGSTESMNELFSVDASRINISALLNPIDKLSMAIKKVEFFRNIAVFRSNLNKTNQEIQLYSKDYAKSVGKAIGEAISKIQEEFNAIINTINDNKAGLGLEIDMYNESQPADQKISKEKLKMIYKWQCDARVGLYKTVEAIDMYLLHFTEAVTKNPDAVADLQKLLTATSVIAKWYDSKAGDNLIRVFEMLGQEGGEFVADATLDAGNFVANSYNNTVAPSRTLNEKLSGDRANKLYERCRRAVEGVVVLKNIISYFITISEKYGSFKSERNIYMAPSNIYKNLVNYIWVSALRTETAGFEMINDKNELKRVITYKDTEVGIAKVSQIDPEVLGINFNRHSIDKLRILKCHDDVLRARDFITTLDSEQFPRLKQTINGIFARLGKTKYIFGMAMFGIYDITVMDSTLLNEFFKYLRSLNCHEISVTNVRAMPAPAPGLGAPAMPAGAILMLKRAPVGGIQPTATDNEINNMVNAIMRLTPSERKSVIITVSFNEGPGGILRSAALIPLHTFNTFTLPQDLQRYGDLLVNQLYQAFQRVNDANTVMTTFSSGFLQGLFFGFGDANSTSASSMTNIAARSIKALEYLTMDMLSQYHKQYASDIFAIDDNYFILTIKAIAGKVMAVTGINSIYKNPNATHNALTHSPTRLIMGGADGDIDIYDDAVELYVRLPLLVEFYRGIFDNGNKAFKDQTETANLDYEQVSLVPEIGNVWSGLLINIFDKSRHIDAGLYTQDNMKKIIAEINSIYKNYKGKVKDDELVRHIVSELVAEINRRYGVIKRQELLNYYKVVKAIKDNQMTIDESNYTNNDLDILGESLEFEESAPSDEYVKKLSQTMKDPSVSEEVKINKLTDYKIVKDFREKLNIALNDVRGYAGGATSIRERIRFLKKLIQSKSSRQEKYDLIIKAIEESDALNLSSNDIFMCFHEFVVMPLRTLVQMHNALNLFILNVYSIVQSCQASGVTGSYAILNGKFGTDMIAHIQANRNLVFDAATNAFHISNIHLLDGVPIINAAGAFQNISAAAATNTDKLIYLLIQLLVQFATNSGGLVKLNISTTKRITLDLSEYQKVCEYLVANVKYMVDKFTGLVPTSLINAITDRSTGNTESIYAIEESLLLKIFNKQNHGESKRDIACLDNLYKMMPLISDIISSHSNSPMDLMHCVTMHRPGVSPVGAVDISNCMPVIRDAFTQFNKTSGMFVHTTDAIYISSLLFDPSNRTTLMSQDMYGLIQQYNIIISQYLNDLYDTQSKKIYTNAFSTFASNALLDALNGVAIPDFNIVIGLAAVPQWDYYVPDSQTVLSATLAHTMKVLTSRVNPITGVKLHELGSIQEVSQHMLEKYRMLIPMYIRVVKVFLDRCRYYRKMVGYMTFAAPTGVPVNIPGNGLNGMNTKIRENVADILLPFVQVNNSINGTPLNGVHEKSLLHIDEIVNSMSSLLQDMETVQKELLETDSTITLYFDTKKDFTKNYVNNNKELPFAPLSILAMGYPNADQSNDIVPIYNQSSITVSKFLYGLRTMLVDDFKLSSSKVPYLKKLITDFNGYTTSGNTIAEAKFNDVLKYVGIANNFIYDLRFFNGKANTHMDILSVARPAAVPGQAGGIVPVFLTTFQEANTPQKSTTLIESTNIVDSSNKLVEYVKANGRVGTPAAVGPVAPVVVNPRRNVCLVNILDLRIMPLNVHSLMRDIPLANLYNYAMTFDDIVSSFTPAEASDLIKGLLKTPYTPASVNAAATASVSATPIAINVNGVQHNINALGNNATNLRFLKDEIFGKMAGAGARALSPQAMESRLNTKLARNLIFLTLVQYAIKKKVKREIEFINTRVVSNIASVNDAITNETTDMGQITDATFEF